MPDLPMLRDVFSLKRQLLKNFSGGCLFPQVLSAYTSEGCSTRQNMTRSKIDEQQSKAKCWTDSIDSRSSSIRSRVRSE
jgi:hypothetical protein